MVSVQIGQSSKPSFIANRDAINYDGEHGNMQLFSDNEHIICDVRMKEGVRRLCFSKIHDDDKQNTRFILDMFKVIGHAGE